MASDYCSKSPYLNGSHEWRYFPRTNDLRCTRPGCGAKQKGGPPKGEKFPNLNRKDLMFGKADGTLKGGKWGNKADKTIAASLHRYNPEPKSTGETIGGKGCMWAAIGLFGGSMTTLYFLSEALRYWMES